MDLEFTKQKDFSIRKFHTQEQLIIGNSTVAADMTHYTAVDKDIRGHCLKVLYYLTKIKPSHIIVLGTGWLYRSHPSLDFQE
jgi:hypothetical protein